MQRWCMDWAHEDFKIYSVPGSQNLFNDFHSRRGAPTGCEFYTLQQHAENVESKLAAMHATVEGNPATLPLETMTTKPVATTPEAVGAEAEPRQGGFKHIVVIVDQLTSEDLRSGAY